MFLCTEPTRFVIFEVIFIYFRLHVVLYIWTKLLPSFGNPQALAIEEEIPHVIYLVIPEKFVPSLVHDPVAVLPSSVGITSVIVKYFKMPTELQHNVSVKILFSALLTDLNVSNEDEKIFLQH